MKTIFELIKKLFEWLFKKEEVLSTGTTTTATQTGEDDPTPAVDTTSSGEDNNDDEPEKVNTKIKILIDNGHGYDTPGKRSPWSSHKVKPELEFREYKWAREIAIEVVAELKRRGYNAERIVPEENDISLNERINRVNKICSSLGTSNVCLVSIHANAAGNGHQWMNARGWCAFTSIGQTKGDVLAEFIYEEAEKNFKGMKIRTDLTDGDRDKEENFAMVYRTWCPATLTENFFQDNADDVRYILSDEGRAAVIKTHVDGIINYIKSL